MASCIKDEAPNAEADIAGISFEEDVLANSYIDLNPSYDESQNAYPIRILSLIHICSIFTLPRICFFTSSGSGVTISNVSRAAISWAMAHKSCLVLQRPDALA